MVLPSNMLSLQKGQISCTEKILGYKFWKPLNVMQRKLMQIALYESLKQKIQFIKLIKINLIFYYVDTSPLYIPALPSAKTNQSQHPKSLHLL